MHEHNSSKRCKQSIWNMYGWSLTIASMTVETLSQNVRYALRNFRKHPVFSLIVVFTLALGIGANTAIFTVVDAVLLEPLPYGDPDKLAVLWAKNEKQNLTQQPVSYPNIVDLR
jgi:putative ABC transport system permease protein